MEKSKESQLKKQFKNGSFVLCQRVSKMITTPRAAAEAIYNKSMINYKRRIGEANSNSSDQ